MRCARDLVNHLTGEPNAQLVLEELERESMFLVALDTRREWFRFHHLFRDLLRFRLRAEDPPAEALLLRRAADWHFARGRSDAGVEYLLRAKDWSGALEVILNNGSEVFERGEMATVIRLDPPGSPSPPDQGDATSAFFSEPSWSPRVRRPRPRTSFGGSRSIQVLRRANGRARNAHWPRWPSGDLAPSSPSVRPLVPSRCLPTWATPRCPT